MRLAKAIERVRARLNTVPSDLSQLTQSLKKRAPHSWIQASVGNTIHFIDLNDIAYFCAETKYTRVVANQIEGHIRTPLKDLADNLEEAGFWQIHRAYVVSVKHIKNVVRDADGAVWLHLRDQSTKIPVSQRFQHRFKGM